MSARPTRRQSTGSIRPQRPTKRPSVTGRMAKVPDEQRPDHARSFRMAVYAVAGVVVFAAAFIVLVLALNQLPLR